MSHDLYTLWLGIAAGHRPPDHYTLLGITRFCQDQDAIERAVRHRMDKLDQYALHPDRAKRQAVQNMMNELAAARASLVNAGQKERYDLALATSLGVSAPTVGAAALPAAAAAEGEKPRDVFIRRLRSHLLKWAMDAHEERLLVAEAAAVGIGESEALKIIRRIDAEAETITRQWRRKITVGIVVMIFAGAGAIFAFVLLPALQRSQADAKFDAHIAAARGLIDRGQAAQALAELDQAGKLKPNDPAPKELRLRAQYALLVDAAAASLKEGQYDQAAQKLSAAEKLQGDAAGAPTLRAQALDALTRQIDSAVAAGNPAQALGLLKGVQALAGQGPLAGRLTENIRALQRKLMLDEVPKDLAGGNYAAARAKIDDLKRLGGSAAAVEELLRQHSQRLVEKFRRHWSAKEWADAAQTAWSLRQIEGAAGEWNILPLLGVGAPPGDPAQAAAFAGELVRVAAHPVLTPWPAFRSALLKAAYAAASTAPEGDADAWKAAEVLSTIEGSMSDAAAGMKVAVLRNRMQRSTTHAQKLQWADQTIDLLTALTKRNLAAGNYARAQEYARAASDAAAAALSSRTDETAAMVQRAAAAAALHGEITRLKARLQSGDDRAALTRLFNIYFIELDDVAAAAPLVPRLADDNTTEAFSLAGVNSETLFPMQCRGVAQWYTRLAEAPQISAAGKDRMLKQAARYAELAAEAEKNPPSSAPLPNVYLSDIEWISAVSSAGSKAPVTRNIICEHPDAKTPMAIRTHMYAKGVSWWTPGEVTCALQPQYRALVAEVGLDNACTRRAPQNAGAIVAEILIDGQVVRRSAVLDVKSQPYIFMVPIPTGSKEIKLRTVREIPEKSRVITTWGNVGFLTEAAPAVTPPAPPPSGKQPVPPAPGVFLGDLTTVESSSLWGAVTADRSPLDNQPLRINGTEYARGLGLHAPARVTYDLKPQYKAFVARVGVHSHGIKGPDGTLGGSIVAEVLIDDTRVARSGVLRYADEPCNFNVPIPPGAKRITLVTTGADDTSNPDLADWALAGFIINGAPPAPVPVAQPPGQNPRDKVLQEIQAALKAQQYAAAAEKTAAFRKDYGSPAALDKIVADGTGQMSTAFINELKKTPPAYPQALVVAQALRTMNAPAATYNVNLLMGLEGAAKAGPGPSLGLARTMLEAAKGLAADAELAAALRSAAYDYALAHPENLEQAQKLLGELAAPFKSEYQPRLLPAYRKNYQSSAANIKIKAGLSLLDLLMDIGASAVKDGHWAQAAAAYEEARALAPQIESPRQREIEMRLDLVHSRQEYVKQADQAANALQGASPAEAQGLHKKLFELQYVELGNVAEAAQYAGADNRNIEPMRLMALPPKDLSPEQCAVLDRWHRDLGQGKAVSSAGTERMAAKAHEYADRRRALLAGRPLVINNTTAALEEIKDNRTVATALTVNGAKQALAAKGAGTLIVGTEREVNLLVGVNPDGACVSTLDLSALARFFANLDQLAVGRGRRAAADKARATGIALFKLAPLTVVRANTVSVGDSMGPGSTGMNGRLELGADTTLQCSNIYIASGIAAEGSVVLPKGGRLRLRNRDGGNTGAQIVLGSGAGEGVLPAAATLDLGGGWLDAKIDRLDTLPNGPRATAVVIFGIGTVDANSITLRKGIEPSKPTTLTLAGTALAIKQTLKIEEGAMLMLAAPDPAAVPAPPPGAPGAAAETAAPPRASLRMPATAKNRTLLENYIKTRQIGTAIPNAAVALREDGGYLIVETK